MNMKKEWSDSYKLDIPIIDDAHEKLFDGFNQFIEKAEQRASTAELTISFRELLQDVATHFAEEEEIMLDMGYSSFKTHKEIHDNLIHDANEVAHDLELTNDEIDILPFIECLHTIVIDHIIECDLMIGRFYHKKEKEE